MAENIISPAEFKKAFRLSFFVGSYDQKTKKI